ncbi:faciogenital dysplasia protein [Anaeramoeba flamelloides]|uniref:Faciogenital dysplasia protein n=1 Tax=Anaeramoeba flamelloides TaxID=1746091 RepID=A0ABQ8Z6X6_9EUKA|nr:faciogenital dysplasia protein [Anaeramoeba flamelloides]
MSLKSGNETIQNQKKKIQDLKLKPSKLTTQRDLIVMELYQTENSYMSYLEILIEKMHIELFPEKSDKIDLIVNSKELEKLFVFLRFIYKVNLDFIKILETRLNGWGKDSQIGDFFKEYIPYLKMYKDYYRNFESSREYVSKLMRKSKKFAKWELEKRKIYGHDLPSMLIMPVQRLPRYELFLKNLLKNTPKEHCDYNDLQIAIEMILDVNNDLNESIKKDANQKKVLKLQKKLSSRKLPTLLAPHRSFISQGDFVKMDGKLSDKRKYYLFTDIFISSNISFGLNVIDDVINLKNIKIEDLRKSKKLKFAFMIRSPQGSFTLSFKTQESKDKCLNNMNLAIDKIKRNTQTLSPIRKTTEQKPQKPLWVPDKVSIKCASCNERFTWYRRKHHCRNCGLCICSKCSANFIDLPKIDPFNLVRACDRCFLQHINEKEKLESMEQKKEFKKKKKLKETNLVSKLHHINSGSSGSGSGNGNGNDNYDDNFLEKKTIEINKKQKKKNSGQGGSSNSVVINENCFESGYVIIDKPIEEREKNKINQSNNKNNQLEKIQLRENITKQKLKQRSQIFSQYLKTYQTKDGLIIEENGEISLLLLNNININALDIKTQESLFLQTYDDELKDLTINEESQIQALTDLAKDNIEFSRDIAKLIINRIKTAEPEYKLLSLYLLDNIVKTIGGDFIQYFQKDLVRLFSNILERANNKTTQQLIHLVTTWSDYKCFEGKYLKVIQKKLFRKSQDLEKKEIDNKNEKEIETINEDESVSNQMDDQQILSFQLGENLQSNQNQQFNQNRIQVNQQNQNQYDLQNQQYNQQYNQYSQNSYNQQRQNQLDQQNQYGQQNQYDQQNQQYRQYNQSNKNQNQYSQQNQYNQSQYEQQNQQYNQFQIQNQNQYPFQQQNQPNHYSNQPINENMNPRNHLTNPNNNIEQLRQPIINPNLAPRVDNPIPIINHLRPTPFLNVPNMLPFPPPIIPPLHLPPQPIPLIQGQVLPPMIPPFELMIPNMLPKLNSNLPNQMGQPMESSKQEDKGTESGISIEVGQEQDQEEIEEITMESYDFSIKSRNRKNILAIDMLYSEKKQQCTNCGLRFNSEENLQKHYGEHCQKKKKNNTHMSRHWFMNYDNWKSSQNFETLIPANNEIGKSLQDQEREQYILDNILQFIEDESPKFTSGNHEKCKICKNELDVKRHESGWVYIETVKLKDGRLVCRMCLKDALLNSDLEIDKLLLGNKNKDNENSLEMKEGERHGTGNDINQSIQLDPQIINNGIDNFAISQDSPRKRKFTQIEESRINTDIENNTQTSEINKNNREIEKDPPLNSYVNNDVELNSTNIITENDVNVDKNVDDSKKVEIQFKKIPKISSEKNK